MYIAMYVDAIGVVLGCEPALRPLYERGFRGGTVGWAFVPSNGVRWLLDLKIQATCAGTELKPFLVCRQMDRHAFGVLHDRNLIALDHRNAGIGVRIGAVEIFQFLQVEDLSGGGDGGDQIKLAD